MSQQRGLHRSRTEQPTHSILNCGIEREVLPICRRYGPGVLVWSPPATGLLAGATLTLGDDILDQIDAFVPPGTDISPLDISCTPPPSPART